MKKVSRGSSAPSVKETFRTLAQNHERFSKLESEILLAEKAINGKTDKLELGLEKVG